MRALILNSGRGIRMAPLTERQPKCLTELRPGETILSRQLRQLAEAGMSEVVLTTGPFPGLLEEYCQSLHLPLKFTFVRNPDYESTNYIYSIYLAREQLRGDLLLLHGDLVMENEALRQVLESDGSCAAVSSTQALPEKDFKAVLQGGSIRAIGVEFFENALASQPLYRLTAEDWETWLGEIVRFCESDQRTCYAEKAFNAVSDRCALKPLDLRNLLCREVDCPEDLTAVTARLREAENRTVYMCFSSDVLHGGHMAILRRAAGLGRLTVGVLDDGTVASYKRFPLLPQAERMALLGGIKGVERVIEQKELSYRNTLLTLKPDIVVHGDDWREGFQKPLRDEVLDVLSSYGGRLVEFPYARGPQYEELERRSRAELSCRTAGGGGCGSSWP